jgi:hypothetical protein
MALEDFDALTKEDIAAVQHFIDEQYEEMEAAEFKPGEQALFIQDAGYFKGADGSVFLSFKVCGADKENQKANGKTVFGVTQANGFRFLTSFLKTLGLKEKFEMERASAQLAPLLNQRFWGNVSYSNNEKNPDSPYLNVKAIRLMNGEVTTSDDDAPF